jgi:5-methylcytosine-specific restriction endonuclease McrA
VKNKRAWATSKQKQAWRRALLRYQNGFCAGCGTLFDGKPRTVRSPLQLSLDHIVTRAAEGAHRLDNLLLKHRRCNEARRDLPATGCDLIWQMVVAAARLAEGRAA